MFVPILFGFRTRFSPLIDDLTIRNQAEITGAASPVSVILIMLLGSIAGMSLVVGGIGIMIVFLAASIRLGHSKVTATPW